MENMKTIKEIADEIGVTKQAVQKRIAKEPLKSYIQQYIKTIDGTQYIEAGGESIIKSAYNVTDNVADNQTTDFDTVADNQAAVADNVYTDETPVADNRQAVADNVGDNQATVADNADNQMYNILKDTILTLQKQLEVKDAQIEGLQGEITTEREHSRDIAEKLAELARNSQVLLKQEQERNTPLLPEAKKSRSWQFWRK